MSTALPGTTDRPMSTTEQQPGQKSFRERSLHLRCYAVGKGDRVYAHCIDLHLAVIRPTLEEAIAELQSMIESYLSVVVQQGCPRHLLYRRSGLSHRTRYYAIMLLARACRLIDRKQESRLSTRVIDKHFLCPA